MTQPKGYVDQDYLANLSDLLRPHKERTYPLLHLQLSHAVLDVGCGPGTDTILLAPMVGPTGRVVGVDCDAEMIAEADQRAQTAGVSAWVTHQQADARALPFAEATFDACRSERLLQHLPRPDLALAELVRVTKPGGWIVVLDTDWGTFSIDTPEVDIERRLWRVLAERCLHNGYAGRQLYRLFKRYPLVDLLVELLPIYVTNYAVARQAGRLDTIEREALAAGLITSDELQHWQRSLSCADAEGVFFGSVCMVLVAGRKSRSGPGAKDEVR